MNTNFDRPAAPTHEFLESLFWSAVAAAHPDNCLAPNLPEPPRAGGW